MKPIGAELAYQLDLFSNDTTVTGGVVADNGRSGTFVDNMQLPMHRWFRYSAGFSADWVRHEVRDRKLNRRDPAVLDPFGGVGTTLLACNAENMRSLGFEPHPFVFRLATAKLRGLEADISSLKLLYAEFIAAVTNHAPRQDVSYPPLLKNCYTDETLEFLMAMREVFLERYDEKTLESEILWLTITSILRSCSGAGTANWQYVLPKKSKSRVHPPRDAFLGKAAQIMQDIDLARSLGWRNQALMLQADARNPCPLDGFTADLVITSPPYPNNYDYADATRLEMTFWGEIAGWGDLQDAVRKYLVHSCSQHTAAEKLVLDDVLGDSVLDPIRQELEVACRALEAERESHGGRKTYHTMAAAYFADLGRVFQSLRQICSDGAQLCFVVGDSAPYGVYLHVDEWLGRLAIAAGFESYEFEKIRDRNVKWKNRKHRVPLREGRLWIQG